MLKELGKTYFPENLASVILLNIGVTLTVLWWVLKRFSWGVGLDVRTICQRIGLASPRLSRLALGVMAAQLSGLGLMALAQRLQGHGHLSWDNWLVPGPSFELSKVVDMLFLIPLREEVVCRAIAFSLYYKQIGGRDGNSKFVCALLAGCVFGSLHLLNFFAARPFSTSYIILQTVLGTLIGTFYGLRFLEVNICEPVLLHSFNNAVSAFLAVDFTLAEGDLSLWAPLLLSVVVYGALTGFEARALMRQPAKDFPLLPSLCRTTKQE